MTDVDHRWSFSNPGPDVLAIWLEPWAEELQVPARSTIAMVWSGGPQNGALGELDWTPDHLVVWAEVTTLQIFLDGALQDTTSAAIPFPAGLTRAMLNNIFARQPSARLGGAHADVAKREPWWSWAKRRIFPAI